jgi:hypothetical protein
MLLLPSGSNLRNTFLSSRVAYAELENCLILSRTNRMISRICGDSDAAVVRTSVTGIYQAAAGRKKRSETTRGRVPEERGNNWMREFELGIHSSEACG